MSGRTRAGGLAAWLVCGFLAAFQVSGCTALGLTPVALLDDTISSRGLTIVRDIPYGPGSLAADPRRALDVYRPSDRAGPLPVVVFFYGGSWESGRRQDYRFVAAELARRGVIVEVPDYRIYPQVRFPAFLQDAAQAVAFAQRSAPSWGGDPHRLFVVGHSAGAWLAVMLALDPRWLAAAGADRRTIAGTVGISGPYDFLPIARPDIQRVFAPAHADLSVTQPIDAVDGRNRPLLLLQGLADRTVQPRNTAALAARIREAGGPVQVRYYPALDHIGAIIAFAPLFRTGPFATGAPVLDDVTAFVTDPALTAP